PPCASTAGCRRRCASRPRCRFAATLTEEQLHHALFLPALRLQHSGSEGDGPAAAVLQPGRLEACTSGGSNCAVSKAASALFYCGVVRTCAEGACFQGQTADVKPDD